MNIGAPHVLDGENETSMQEHNNPNALTIRSLGVNGGAGDVFVVFQVCVPLTFHSREDP